MAQEADRLISATVGLAAWDYTFIHIPICHSSVGSNQCRELSSNQMVNPEVRGGETEMQYSLKCTMWRVREETGVGYRGTHLGTSKGGHKVTEASWSWPLLQWIASSHSYGEKYHDLSQRPHTEWQKSRAGYSAICLTDGWQLYDIHQTLSGRGMSP